MDRWKAEQGREKRKIRRKKMQMREKVGKSRNTVFSQWFGAPEGRKVGSLKRRARSQLARWEMKSCTPLRREAHLEVKMYKTPHVRAAFGSCDVEKVHAVVVRSIFWSQNVQNTSASDHFWKLRCRKSARRCGAKHILKSKCTKHLSVGPLLEIQMSKKCTPFWREEHFQVKMYKTHHSRTTFGSWDVEKVHAVVARRSGHIHDIESETLTTKDESKSTTWQIISLKRKHDIHNETRSVGTMKKFCLFLAFSPFFMSQELRNGYPASKIGTELGKIVFFGWLEQIAAWGKAMMSNWVLDWYWMGFNGF